MTITTITKKPLTAKQKQRLADRKTARDLKIRKLHSSGKYSYSKLAEKVGMSKTRVFEIVREGSVE